MKFSVRDISMDHPRSRGVYAAGFSGGGVARGSSPLARGLHMDRADAPSRIRIIPARAGFTSHCPNWSRHARDHPRSRGVYMFRGIWDTGTLGSSPLARGLRAGPAAQGRDGRIIPARAGFTPVLRRVLDGDSRIIPARAGFTGLEIAPRHINSDHPRSRGVYPGRPLIMSPFSGSSPLARGLPICLRAGQIG